jgi:hyperosmotically inducible periplasmic protein
MKNATVSLVFMFLILGCSKDNQSKNDQPTQTAAVEADNTGRNVRDRSDVTKTPTDQSENEADRAITQTIRQNILADSSLSANAKNVKIITVDGTVTLRGPVKSEKEKTEIVAKAQQLTGVKRVDDQLEITN